MKVWLEKTNIQKEINKIFDSDDTLANIQNKVLELVNDGMYINFGKFDASCRDGKWTFYIPFNLPTGNKFRSINARYELVAKATFVDNDSSVVKSLYIEDIKETNP